ncbi:uncharacterized protein G2W53_042257 [Senna tora]|uniref:Uncharacterized protein n=1 Tax=Senna tora TaxID=362788 RepID=A0A834SGI7_9FABA|nr:uncharacterized protein G2W53_042257 [Senna tora]
MTSGSANPINAILLPALDYKNVEMGEKTTHHMELDSGLSLELCLIDHEANKEALTEWNKQRGGSCYHWYGNGIVWSIHIFTTLPSLEEEFSGRSLSCFQK